MLYLIGLGLTPEQIPATSIKVGRACSKLYFENYTSIYPASLSKLKSLFKTRIVAAGRRLVEIEQPFLSEAANSDIGLLIPGHPLFATTHQQLLADATKKGIDTKVLHAPSIFDTLGLIGLSLYKFGKIGSIPLPRPGFKPRSFFDTLVQNAKAGAHTLYLLDLDPENRRYMDIPNALDTLLSIAKTRRSRILNKNSLAIGLARLCWHNQFIKAGPVSELMELDWGDPPYCLIIPGKLDFKEKEFLQKFLLEKNFK